MRKFLFKHLTYAFVLGIGFGLIAGLGFRLAQKHRMYTEKMEIGK